MSDEAFEGSSSTSVAPRDESRLATPASLPMSEIQLRIARDNPRDEEAVVKRVDRELMAHPMYADDLIYSIPYKDNRKGLINFVEGPSIRAAEHLWSRWGNCTVAARVADDRGSKIMVQGLFFDYETGLLNLSDLEVPKMGMTRQGGTYPLREDDLRKKVAATESKVKRNAFLGSLPVWIKDGYVNTCFKLILGTSKNPIPERIAAAGKFFVDKFKVTPESVAELIEKVHDSYPGITDDALLRYMIGLKNALKDGNADVEFVFGEEKKPVTMPQAKKEAPANAKTNAIQKPAATTTARPHPDDAGDAQE